MKKPKLDGLANYAKKGGVACKACTCPEIEWIRNVRTQGYSFGAIATYLPKECDFVITSAALAQHFRNHEEAVNRKAR